MKRAKIGDLKDNLSRYLDYVKRGGTVRVFDRDTPVADLVPLGAAASAGSRELDDMLDSLERAGAIERGTGKLPAEFLTRELPRARKSILAALVEERREGR